VCMPARVVAQQVTMMFLAFLHKSATLSDGQQNLPQNHFHRKDMDGTLK
jgi:hypothetical protein